MTRVDLAIIGAGPAGMAAATSAAKLGLKVALLDEQNAVGGQIYRKIESVNKVREKILGRDYLAGRLLADALSKEELTYIARASVWQADTDGNLSYSVDGEAKRLRAERLLIATGALERPVPVPGWTLPGVMTAGAGQIMLKESGLVVSQSVIAGSGPLIYLLAAQMIRAGRPPSAIVETQTKAAFLKAQKHIFGALIGWRYLLKGLGLLAELKRANVKRYVGASNLRVTGKERAQALVFRQKGSDICIPCETIFLHSGVVPNIQLSRSLDLVHKWDETQLCFSPVLDKWGVSSSKKILIAGDGGGIVGAKSAEISGRIAALKVAHDLGRINNMELESKSFGLFRALWKERAIRPFLDTAYSPSEEFILPQDNTIICRCEEVKAGDIRRYAAMGCDGPNQAKAFGRSGMGPCQGRYCGLTVSMILSHSNKMQMDDVGYYRLRAPIKPVTLGELAAFDETSGTEEEGMDLG